ncbi:nuclear pore complex protein Nup50-like isoform X2 [Halichondria panicea]|uniref:nuclear pore complex protein Nup50-like isoform X2 n=1 Tax=Halichondria panicea TaxID=6063 RepID=UPI00312B8F4D
MSKRAAEVQLTQDNVDDLDEVTDEPGIFEVASEEQLKQRVIKKARRINPLEDSTSAGPSIFAGLKSFQSSTLERKPLTAALMVSPPVRATAPVKTTPFLTHLKSLNESVTKWINEHVNSNPHIDLTPIFKDYKSHLSDIESKYKNTSEADDNQGSEYKVSETEANETAPTSATDQESQESQEESTQDESQEDAPAQTAPNDDDSLMSVRAKLFYKKGAEYCELGVGTLKIQTSGDKAVRLLLRNDTSVGKVILNIRITNGIPVSSKGNNVFMVCMANPPLTKNPDDSPISYLIRVKTAQLAEKILTTMKDNIN